MVDVQCCVSFIVVFIYIFLMTNDVGNLFMCFLTIYISSLEKYLFKSFAHFLSWVVSLLFSYKLKSILNTRLLSDIDLQIFSSATVFCTLSRLFHIVGMPFDAHKFLSLMKLIYQLFWVIVAFAFGVVSKNPLQYPRS